MSWVLQYTNGLGTIYISSISGGGDTTPDLAKAHRFASEQEADTCMLQHCWQGWHAVEVDAAPATQRTGEPVQYGTRCWYPHCPDPVLQYAVKGSVVMCRSCRQSQVRCAKFEREAGITVAESLRRAGL